MATHNSNADIEVLVGVQGGASISGDSGKLIASQLQSILGQFTAKNGLAVRLDNRSKTDLTNQIAAAIDDFNKYATIKLQVKVDDALIKKQVDDALKKAGASVNFPSQGGNGQNIQSNLRQAITLQNQLNALQATYAKNITSRGYSSLSQNAILKQIAAIESQYNSTLSHYASTTKTKIGDVQARVSGDPSVISSAYRADAAKIQVVSDIRSKAEEVERTAIRMWSALSGQSKAAKQTNFAAWNTQLNSVVVKMNQLAQKPLDLVDAKDLSDARSMYVLLQSLVEQIDKFKVEDPDVQTFNKLAAKIKIIRDEATAASNALLEMWEADETSSERADSRGSAKQRADYSGLSVDYQSLIASANVPNYNPATVKQQIDAMEQVVKQSEKLKVKHKELDAEWNRSNGITKMSNRIGQYLQLIKSTAPDDFRTKVQAMFDAAKSGSYEGGIKKLIQDFTTLKAEGDAAGYTVETLGQKIARIFKEKFGYGVMAAFAMQVRQSFREIYTNVVEIDSAMTELRKVTNATAETYNQFLNDAAVRAGKLGSKLSDVITATAEFAKLGYGISDASDLADAAVVYQHVGDGINDITTASESLISSMKGFGLAAEDAMSIVDKYNEVANTEAISSGGIGEALQRSAAAMNAAGNTIDETIALATAANSVVQNPDTVGTSLKTLSMYLRAAKLDLEAAGESTDGMASSVSKLRQDILQLTSQRVDIMANDTEFKNTYEILKELSKVYNTMTDVDVAKLTELIGGKRNANVVSAILSNFDIAERALETSLGSAGSAMRENEKYLDSIGGHIDILTGKYQTLSNNVLNSNFVKGVLDGLIAIVDLLNQVVTGADKLVVKLAVLVGSFAAVNTVVTALSRLKIVSSVSNVGAFFSLLSEEIIKSGSALKGFMTVVQASTGVMTGLISVGLVAAGVLAKIGYDYYKETHPSLESLQAQLKSTKDELTAVTREFDASKEKLDALELKEKDGSITLVEENELAKLREEVALLEIRKGFLSDNEKRQTADVQGRVSRDAYAYFNTATVNTEQYDKEGGLIFHTQAEELQNTIDKYHSTMEQLSSGTLDQKTYEQLDKNLGTLRTSLESSLTSLIAMRDALDKSDPSYAQTSTRVQQLFVLLGQTDLALQQVNTEYALGHSQLVKLGEAGKASAEELEKLYNEDAAVKAYIDRLKEIGIIVGDIDFSTLANQFNAFVDAGISGASDVGVQIESLSSMIDKYRSHLDTLTDAVKETNKDGYVSYETLKKIESANLTKYLEQTANGYKMTSKAIDDYTNKSRAAYEQDFNNAKRAAVEVANAQHIEGVAIASTTAEIIRKLKARALEYSMQIQDLTLAWAQESGLGGGSDYASDIAIQNMQAGSQRIQMLSNARSDILASLRSLENSQFNLSTFDSLFGGATSGRETTPTTSSGSKADEWKKQAEEAVKSAKHMLDMDKLNEEQYYDEIARIRNYYYEDTAAHHEKYKEESLNLEQEIYNGRQKVFKDWLNDREKDVERLAEVENPDAIVSIYKNALSRISSEIQKAYALGLDDNNDWLQDLHAQFDSIGDKILSTIKEKYSRLISYADDFDLWAAFDMSKVSLLKKQLQELTDAYYAGIISRDKYFDSYNDIAAQMYKEQKSSLNDIIDMTIDMIEKEADDQVDALKDQQNELKKIVDLKKKLLDSTDKEADHEEAVAEKVKEIAKIQSKLNQLALDDSREASVQKNNLAEQLAAAQKELADLQKDYYKESLIETLDEAVDKNQESVDEQTKAIEDGIDTWRKKYDKAIAMLQKDWDGTYQKLLAYNDKYASSIDGYDSLVTSWKNATEAVREYGDVVSALQNINTVGINPNNPGSTDAGYGIVKEMYTNSIAALQTGNVSAYNKQNAELAERYTAMTGQSLSAGKDFVWRLSSGQSAYEHFGFSDDETIKGPSALSNRYQEPTGGQLKIGSSGDGVKWVQSQLKAAGYFSGAVDGGYWTLTSGALSKFAADHGISYDSSTGTISAQLIKYLRAYHTGGVVDSTGAINDKEVLAILKQGELVLNDGQKASLKTVMAGLAETVSMLRMPMFGGAMAGRAGGVGRFGDTFSPIVNVNISHNGVMSDADAKHYGKIASQSALDELRSAFSKRGK